MGLASVGLASVGVAQRYGVAVKDVDVAERLVRRAIVSAVTGSNQIIVTK